MVTTHWIEVTGSQALSGQRHTGAVHRLDGGGFARGGKLKI